VQLSVFKKSAVAGASGWKVHRVPGTTCTSLRAVGGSEAADGQAAGPGCLNDSDQLDASGTESQTGPGGASLSLFSPEHRVHYFRAASLTPQIFHLTA
jgi:hypothetical protein